MIKKLYDGCFYHVFNKSIANFGIFKNSNNALRFIEILDYYNNINLKKRYSLVKKRKKYKYENILYVKEDSVCKFLAYCIMPDHYHLLIKILSTSIPIFKYISDVENSFTRFFNIKYKRKGPLWQSRFKYVRIRNNEELLHVNRYIHINPTTSYLVDNPIEWKHSSYRDYLKNDQILGKIITEISITDKKLFNKFTVDQIDYQRKLKIIKKRILE